MSDVYSVLNQPNIKPVLLQTTVKDMLSSVFDFPDAGNNIDLYGPIYFVCGVCREKLSIITEEHLPKCKQHPDSVEVFIGNDLLNMKLYDIYRQHQFWNLRSQIPLTCAFFRYTQLAGVLNIRNHPVEIAQRFAMVKLLEAVA